VADVVCLVEADKDLGAYRPPPWADRYPAGRFAALVCRIGSAEQMEKTLLDVRDKKIGYCFVTDGEAPNPWGRLPAYWDAEVQAVIRVNAP
jgi:hypothetical protein